MNILPAHFGCKLQEAKTCCFLFIWTTPYFFYNNSDWIILLSWRDCCAHTFSTVCFGCCFSIRDFERCRARDFILSQLPSEYNHDNKQIKKNSYLLKVIISHQDISFGCVSDEWLLVTILNYMTKTSFIECFKKNFHSHSLTRLWYWDKDMNLFLTVLFFPPYFLEPFLKFKNIYISEVWQSHMN